MASLYGRQGLDWNVEVTDRGGLGWLGRSIKTILCTDNHKSHLLIPEMLGVECNFFVTTKPAEFHVQIVNNYYERLKTWINFNLLGVATKYLPSQVVGTKTLTLFADFMGT